VQRFHDHQGGRDRAAAVTPYFVRSVLGSVDRLLGLVDLLEHAGTPRGLLIGQ
jgi:hypothetical protein